DYPGSEFRFAELCFQRSGGAHVQFGLSLRSIDLYEEHHESYTRGLEDLLRMYAPSIEHWLYQQYRGKKTLFPTNFQFTNLKSIDIDIQSVQSPSDQFFSQPQSLKSLKLFGWISHPLGNVDDRHLKELKVAWYSQPAKFDVSEDLTRYVALEYLEITAFGVLSALPYAPIDLPNLSSLILKDSPKSFTGHFPSLPNLSHLTLAYPYPDEMAVSWPQPSGVPWPSMPSLVTLTIDNFPVEDVLKAVTNCRTLKALHFEGSDDFVTLLDGLIHIAQSNSQPLSSQETMSLSTLAFPALAYLRLNATRQNLTGNFHRVRAIIQKLGKLLELWPGGRVAITAHHYEANPDHQWYRNEVAEALIEFDAWEFVEILDAKRQDSRFGRPKLSDMF
ncbi:hypothetical protein DL93DRAFT_2206104, partial [Clavulina sp. PMI_390]